MNIEYRDDLPSNDPLPKRHPRRCSEAYLLSEEAVASTRFFRWCKAASDKGPHGGSVSQVHGIHLTDDVMTGGENLDQMRRVPYWRSWLNTLAHPQTDYDLWEVEPIGDVYFLDSGYANEYLVESYRKIRLVGRALGNVMLYAHKSLAYDVKEEHRRVAAVRRLIDEGHGIKAIRKKINA